jgi:hypothetical protein
MNRITLDDSAAPAWTLLHDGEDCIEVLNTTGRQIWFWVIPSEHCEGIVAFTGPQEHVDRRFDDLLHPMLPHALSFKENASPAIKRMLWDAAEPLTVARVMNRGNVHVFGGFGVTADQEACNALRQTLNVESVTPHPVLTLPPVEFAALSSD